MDQAQAMVFLANERLKVKPETINGMLPGLPRNFDNKVTDVSQLNLEADESEMIVCYTTSTTNNEETAEGNIDETEENDNTEQDEQRVDIVECKKRLREAYETILMYEVPLDDLDRKLHRRIRMTLADSCAELNNQTVAVSAVLPTKLRKHDNAGTNTALSVQLYSGLKAGPYSQQFLHHQYTKMNHNLCTFLNQDWPEYPQMRYACSRFLAGMIMLDTSSGKTIVVNCVEVYGRRRTVDSHSIRDVDGTKLILGTKTFNGLITSSLRLDKSNDPEIGPTTSSSCLETSVKSFNTQLFIKESAWHAASESAINENTKVISSYDSLFQLRQLRTRFQHQSTYIRCRSFNEPADDLTTLPYTVFTLADWDNDGDDAEYRLGSQLIQSVALVVIRSEETKPPTLAKQKVSAMRSKLKKDGAVCKVFDSIIGQYATDIETIHIIGNRVLNEGLQKLANLLASPITKSNDSVHQAIATVMAS
ncbi:hypothetical protein G6F46_002123 [Rhizopus delemar]|uniref:Uncharacterized protein n=2 Tax=Rhizopus TaxID=4842 RepID=A0A9P7CIU3_9FUNG|nr:hypothetical protein G6F55_005542 [Rhizopus delemar]KAG1550858.1 hypothetical protein G6F51_002214 [Rhizopus arrhizus]KAG1508100.1 hypothetical protein G6F52_011470 [Rhizopus delemar]KAG1562396.1 hypothetical protein G6F50_012098 [Rhizopus delemar]KAG1601920.1 hypothetical protein G6F47_003255 [Rhizopus delemar]